MLRWVLLAVTLFCGTVIAQDAYTENFDVKPGGVEHDFAIEENGLKCTFVYRCQGGTNEKWRIQLRRDSGGASECSVDRESGTSYLFFQSFRLSVTSATEKLETLEAKAFGNGGRQLAQEQLSVDKSAGAVTGSQSFGSEMARVLLRFSRPGRGDL